MLLYHGQCSRFVYTSITTGIRVMCCTVALWQLWHHQAVGIFNFILFYCVKVIFSCLFYCNCPNSYPLAPHLTPDIPWATPQHCPNPWVMHVCSLAPILPMLYFVSPWLYCDYQFILLNLLTFFTYHPDHLLSGNHQNLFFIYDSIYVCSIVYFVFYIQLLIDTFLLSFYCSYFYIHIILIFFI